MKKKNFKTSFDDLLSGSRATEVEKKKPKSKNRELKSTFIVQSDHLDKIKAIAYLERKMIKEVLASALENFINDYERTNGTVQLPKL